MTGSSEDNCILEHIKYEENCCPLLNKIRKVQYLLQYIKFGNVYLELSVRTSNIKFHQVPQTVLKLKQDDRHDLSYIH
jgi:hypothetical protein